MSQPTEETSTQWLVRTADNVIAGPFTEDQIKHLIEIGNLTHQDELCRANNYWFYLHEADEVLEHLKVEVPRPRPADGDEDNTQTDTTNNGKSDQTDTETIKTEITPVPMHEQDVPTSVSENRSQRQFEALKQSKETHQSQLHDPLSGGAGPKMVVLGKIERTIFWRILAWVLVFVAAGLIYALFDLFRR